MISLTLLPKWTNKLSSTICPNFTSILKSQTLIKLNPNHIKKLNRNHIIKLNRNHRQKRPAATISPPRSTYWQFYPNTATSYPPRCKWPTSPTSNPSSNKSTLLTLSFPPGTFPSTLISLYKKINFPINRNPACTSNCCPVWELRDDHDSSATTSPS